MPDVKLTLPTIGFGKVDTEIEIPGQGTLFISKGGVDWKPIDDKNYVQRYRWAQLAAHLTEGGKRTWVPDRKEKKARRVAAGVKAAKTKAAKKRAPAAPTPMRKRA
jgi:hypothetical protein